MILAGCHAGTIPFSCGHCAEDPTLKDVQGCEHPAEYPVWEVGEDEYFSCPILFVPCNVLNWYDYRSYIKEYGGAPNYSNIPNRFVEADKHYNGSYMDAQKEKQPRRQNSITELKQWRQKSK